MNFRNIFRKSSAVYCYAVYSFHTRRLPVIFLTFMLALKNLTEFFYKKNHKSSLFDIQIVGKKNNDTMLVLYRRADRHMDV